MKYCQIESLPLTALRQAVELAEVLVATGIDELQCVDAEAIHLPPVGWDAIIVKKPCQLQDKHNSSSIA